MSLVHINDRLVTLWIVEKLWERAVYPYVEMLLWHGNVLLKSYRLIPKLFGQESCCALSKHNLDLNHIINKQGDFEKDLNHIINKQGDFEKHPVNVTQTAQFINPPHHTI